METLLSIQDKLFYVYYRGAIRQAKLDSAVCFPNHICGGDSRITLKWKIAGINEPVEWCMVDYRVYYSAEDAEDAKNEVKVETLAWQTVNKYSDRFCVEENGYPHVYVWDGARPVRKCLVYVLNNVRSELRGDKFVLVSDNPDKPGNIVLGKTVGNLGEFYKTAEECKAHHRPKIVTF